MRKSFAKNLFFSYIYNSITVNFGFVSATEDVTRDGASVRLD